jgi:dihydropyrimidine dehydrogenase (NAD+) subunit PreT
MPELSAEQIEKNFSEIAPPLTQAEAFFEANRCLYCFDAPCTQACPTGIDVPAFIKKIASENLLGAARVIFDANPVGATCARVCPVEVLCEGACVEKTLLQKPIEIGRLQRYATDYAIANGKQIFQAGAARGKKIAVVGSGPAGLSCAAYLARLGYAVCVFEKKALPGGLDTYGMAEYKMAQAASLAEIEYIRRLGVEFQVNAEIVGNAAELKVQSSQAPSQNHLANENYLRQIRFSFLAENFDAIFLAVGLGATNRLQLLNEDAQGVWDALRFIEQVKTRDWQSVSIGKIVAVIGAGNTAIDAATQAKRLGAERVLMIYRRTEREMSAYRYEYKLAKQDGVEFVWQAAPIAILTDANFSVTGVRCERTNGSKQIFEIPCDAIIKAIGQQKQISFFQSVGVAADEKGCVTVNELMQTSNPKVFAGGDCINGGREAVDAAQAGKLAAQGIHFFLTGEKVKFAGGF